MKECPACGYKESATNKQLLRLYAKHFGDLPVLAMLERRWINVQNRESIDEIWKELFRFFEVDSLEQLDELFDNTKVSVNGVPAFFSKFWLPANDTDQSPTPPSPPSPHP